MNPALREMLTAWVQCSPFAASLGLVADAIDVDKATLRLPFRPELVTVNDVVHGGAIGALIDSAVAVACLSGVESVEHAKGATVSLTTNYVSAARACDVIAEAMVTRRGRSLVFAHVWARTSGGHAVAEALATYRVG